MGINDPGLLYGATVFTTVRVYQQSLSHPLTNWTAHCDRLRNSLQSFGWQLPDWKRVRQGVRALLPFFPVLRIVIFADGREWITGRSLPADLRERQQEGVIAWVADEPQFRRSLADHKTGNYLGAWLALQKAGKLGSKSAILIDYEGNWLETSTGNLWGWKDGCWWTPPLNGKILPGIMRSQLLTWLQSQDLVVKEVSWNWDFVKGMEAIVYSNSVVEVVPFHTIVAPDGNLNLDPKHPILEQLLMENR
ncbi:MAG: 4-amino-4-deoxychorismate lyase [Moorea sp. SIO2B7]|nr:4-amino-4-deoxychorismate lyase [Moorena sp. SIO2B7]